MRPLIFMRAHKVHITNGVGLDSKHSDKYQIRIAQHLHPCMLRLTFQILEKVRNNKRPEIPDQCPVGLANLTRRCWEQNPGKRPSFKVGFQDY